MAARNQRVADAGLGDEQALHGHDQDRSFLPMPGRGGWLAIDPGLVEDVLRPGRRLVARVRLTDGGGNPGCADLAWSVERAP